MTLELSEPRVVAPTGDHCGEGAVWHAAEKRLYWVDINRFLVHRLEPADGSVKTWMFDEPVVALGLTGDDDVLVVGLGSGVMLWRPETDERRRQGFGLAGWPAVRLNDGRPSPAGGFWIGSMRNNVGPGGEDLPCGGTDGTLFRINADGVSEQWHDIGISNTLCWSPDRRLFYFADTLADVIWVSDYDVASDSIGNSRVFFSDFGRGGPDGSALDSEGYLWNCRYGGGCIVRIASDGSIDRVIELPVANITTCTFGGDDLKTLYVTSAAAKPPAHERLGGSLFAIDTNVAGQPENRCALA
jgi:sugar lactone lactonase YvrE